MVEERKKGLRDFLLIRKEGGSRVLTITTVIPADWTVVKIVKVEQLSGKMVKLTIVKIA